MTDETVLAFDFGTRRIGVAVGQEISGTARALGELSVANGKPDWNAIAKFISEWTPERLILGRPGTADGTMHPLTPQIERFARRLQGRYGLPVDFVDETLSSWAAESENDTSHAGVDAVAARLILETWFASRRTPRT